jgi:very-short-patch-repair endonuclease
MRVIPYNHFLTKLARKNRKNPTPGELRLWQKLRANRSNNIDFVRQKPLLNFIVDFYSKELELAIEVDGGSHENKEVQENDLVKETQLLKYNITILRFTEKEVLLEIDKVLEIIEDFIRYKKGI